MNDDQIKELESVANELHDLAHRLQNPTLQSLVKRLDNLAETWNPPARPVCDGWVARGGI